MSRRAPARNGPSPSIPRQHRPELCHPAIGPPPFPGAEEAAIRFATTIALTLVLSAVGLTYEIAAGRVLAPFFGTSLLTWTAVIATVLAGFSLGARTAIHGVATGKLAPQRLILGGMGVDGLRLDAIPYLGKASDETIHAIFDSLELGGTILPDAIPYVEAAAEALEKIG